MIAWAWFFALPVCLAIGFATGWKVKAAAALPSTWEDAPAVSSSPDGRFTLHEWDGKDTLGRRSLRYRVKCNSCGAWRAWSWDTGAMAKQDALEHECEDPKSVDWYQI